MTFKDEREKIGANLIHTINRFYLDRCDLEPKRKRFLAFVNKLKTRYTVFHKIIHNFRSLKTMFKSP